MALRLAWRLALAGALYATAALAAPRRQGGGLSHGVATLFEGAPYASLLAAQRTAQAAITTTTARRPTKTPTFVTYIIPSKGRTSIDATLESLAQQTLDDWSAIVILDGWLTSPVLEEVDVREEKWKCLHTLLRWQSRLPTRLRIVAQPAKSGVGTNSAGAVRNTGMLLAASPWVAFVDDDDTLQPAHARRLRDHVAKLPGLDAVIFRMSFWDATTDKLRPHAAVFPRLNATNFVINEVGISFAMKTSLCTQDEVDPRENYCFIPSRCEDYVLLNWLRVSNKAMLLSPHILYNVKGRRMDCATADCGATTVYIHDNKARVLGGAV